MVLWAQPCWTGGCGPWAWYGAGSSVNTGSSYGNVWWNTPYGVVDYQTGGASLPNPSILQ